MKLIPFGSNQTEVQINDRLTVFFSYQTPVACWVQGEGYYRTDCRWSKTTTKHINQWLKGVKAVEKPQEFFDNLVSL